MKTFCQKFSLIVVAMLLSNLVISQVAINNNGSTPNASAGLDVDFTNKGILIPRIDFNNKPASPETGLMIYVTTNGPKGNNAYYYYDGTNWSKVSGSHYVGESLSGGIVFWVDTTGQHGLIAATADQNTAMSGLPGNQTYTNTMARGNGIRAGDRNTTLIIAKQGYCGDTMYAARLCAELQVVNGGHTYSEWYLPSKYELNMMYLLRNTIGNFSGNMYWSSTELNMSNYSVQWFTDGTYWEYDKWDLYHVRCIRKF